MVKGTNKKTKEFLEPHLEVYLNKSILVLGPKNSVIFEEDGPSKDSQKRFNQIYNTFKSGFLDKLIEECKKPDIVIPLSPDEEKVVSNLVSGITSDVGRALVGLSILQLSIKAICPGQNIRLHKAGRGEFSWKEGISMRSLDSEFIAPALRRHKLVLYNKFGVMMTRSLAENYPYSKFYKAALRGPKREWLELVEVLEKRPDSAIQLLKKLIVLLINRSIEFQALSNQAITDLQIFLRGNPSFEQVKSLIYKHVSMSQYPSRLFEVSIHSLFQAMTDLHIIKYRLRPLSQMRSANKKAGNIGDVELLEQIGPREKIVEAWDTKYGKSYLYDELSELEDKLAPHQEIRTVGFIVNEKVKTVKEITEKISDLSEEYDLKIEIISFEDFVDRIFNANEIKKEDLAKMWLRAYTESLCLKRPELAPIEEPAEEWVRSLNKLLSAKTKL